MADSYTVYQVYEKQLIDLYTVCSSVHLFNKKSRSLLNSAHMDSSLSSDYFDLLVQQRLEMEYEYSWIGG